MSRTLHHTICLQGYNRHGSPLLQSENDQSVRWHYFKGIIPKVKNDKIYWLHLSTTKPKKDTPHLRLRCSVLGGTIRASNSTTVETPCRGGVAEFLASVELFELAWLANKGSLSMYYGTIYVTLLSD